MQIMYSPISEYTASKTKFRAIRALNIRIVIFIRTDGNGFIGFRKKGLKNLVDIKAIFLRNKHGQLLRERQFNLRGNMKRGVLAAQDLIHLNAFRVRIQRYGHKQKRNKNRDCFPAHIDNLHSMITSVQWGGPRDSREPPVIMLRTPRSKYGYSLG